MTEVRYVGSDSLMQRQVCHEANGTESCWPTRLLLAHTFPRSQMGCLWRVCLNTGFYQKWKSKMLALLFPISITFSLKYIAVWVATSICGILRKKLWIGSTFSLGWVRYTLCSTLEFKSCWLSRYRNSLQGCSFCPLSKFIMTQGAGPPLVL